MASYLPDVDHNEAVDIWIFVLIEAAICERHGDGAAGRFACNVAVNERPLTKFMNDSMYVEGSVTLKKPPLTSTPSLHTYMIHGQS